MTGLVKRSFTLAGHRTSVALETEFWRALETVARARGAGLVQLVASVDAARDGTRPLASALRVLALAEAGMPREPQCGGNETPVRITNAEH